MQSVSATCLRHGRHPARRLRAPFRFLVLSVLGGLVTLSPRLALAHPHGHGVPCFACAWWLPVGGSVAGGARLVEGGSEPLFSLGGEVSLVDFTAMEEDVAHFWGAYVDTIRDFGVDRWRSSVGPEILFEIPHSMYFLGFDLGPVVAWTSTSAKLGARGRFFFPMVFINPYVGATLIGTREPEVIFELGTLLKVPIPLSD